MQARFHGINVLPITCQSAWKPHGHPDGCAYDVIIIARPQVFDAWQEVVKKRCPQVGACSSRQDARLDTHQPTAASMQGSGLQLRSSCNQRAQHHAAVALELYLSQ
jgi:hypothetical protein